MKRRSIRERAIAYARRYPGQSATQIANALRANPSTVSSRLYEACCAGELERTEATWTPSHGNSWNVRGGGGPGGGHTYGPVRNIPRSFVCAKKGAAMARRLRSALNARETARFYLDSFK